MTDRLIDQVTGDQNKLWAFEKTEAQNRAIEQAIRDAQPLVGPILPILTLSECYNERDSGAYLRKARELALIYGRIRQIRGDGNCFYRAILFAELEVILANPIERSRLVENVVNWRHRLFMLGFPEFTTGDFCDWFDELLTSVDDGRLDEQKLLELLNDDGPCNYYVVFLRLVTSGYLQERAEVFEGFIDQGRTVHEFCKSDVEPMWKESDHVSVTALVEALGLRIRIEYMDRSQAPSGGWHHEFGTDNMDTPLLIFLYRPGHYDILYKDV